MAFRASRKLKGSKRQREIMALVLAANEKELYPTPVELKRLLLEDMTLQAFCNTLKILRAHGALERDEKNRHRVTAAGLAEFSLS